MSKDYYKILGISKNSSHKEIKDAYRDEVKKCHPDAFRTKDTEDRFMEVREAYETLGNENKCKVYDCDIQRNRQNYIRYSSPINISKKYYYNRNINSYDFFLRDIFDDFLGDFFNLNKSVYDEYDLNIVLTEEEAYYGVTFPITIPVNIK